MKKILWLLLMFCEVQVGYCQNSGQPGVLDTTDLSSLSIEDLSHLQSRYKATPMESVITQAIETASRKPLTLRNSPSIITVVTQEEITRSGAMDMMDVFRMIPGLEFNMDVTGVVAISFRGLWSNEGNILFQMDGQEMNETAFSGLAFGNHYPVNNIKKIEVIRGPGSALYGGYAEYAVINIITSKGEDMHGATFDLLGGGTNNAYTRENVGLTVGNKVNDLTYSFAGLTGCGQRSNFSYTDVYGKTVTLAGNAKLDPHFLDVNIGYKGLSLLFIYDNYVTSTRDGYVGALSQGYPCNFLSYMGELRYTRKLSRKVQFQVRANFKHCEPWTFDGQPLPVDSSYGYYKILIDRYRLSASATWDPNYWLSVNAGAEGYADLGYKPNGQDFSLDSTDRVNYLNYAPFIQASVKTRFVNITIGARYDISTEFGTALNPRVGITKRVGIANFKLLYASSFRAPSIEDFQYSLDEKKLEPERSNTLEFETSLKISKNMYFSLNLFDITTKNAIKYFVKTDSVVNGDPDGYRNTGKITGSTGLELEYKYNARFGFVNFVYSFYTIACKGVDSLNEVPIDQSATLGTAQNKFSLHASFNINKHFFISPSCYYLGRRYGIASVDASGNGIITAFSPQFIATVYLGYSELAKNLSVGAGIRNITDEKELFIQAYNSLHAPLPGTGREYYLKISYKIDYPKHKQAAP